MSDILKKFGFVIAVAVILLGLFVFVTYDENKGKLKGMTYKGQDVVFTIGDEKITAEMLYEEILKNHQDSVNSILLNRFRVETLLQAMPITKDMRKQAEQEVTNTVIYYFQANYGESYQYYLKDWMASQGYETLEDITKYTLPWMVIQPKLLRDYLESDFPKYFKEYADAKNPRLISHILVLMEDSQNPTEAELAKVAAVEEALKTGDFGEVAAKLSEDTGSAQQNGSIGIVDLDNKASYVTEFANCAMELKDGEVSQWVKTTYGWHLIKNNGSSYESLKDTEDIFNRLNVYFSDLNDKLIFEKAQSLGINFYGNDALKKYIYDNMGVEE